MGDRKRILIAMLEIGNGHKSPAIAIKKSIEKLYPGKYDVEVIDLFKRLDYNLLFNQYYFFWVNVGMRFPWIINIWYHLFNNKIAYKLEEIFLKKLAKGVEKYVIDTKTDLVLADHESCIHVFSMIKSKLTIPIIAMNTDPFDAHYVWASPNIDKYIVFSKQAKDMLVQNGVNKNKMIIFNSGYPIDQKHSIKIDTKKEIRKKLGLFDKKTILMSMGGEGVSNLKDFLKVIVNNKLNWQIIAVCGRNESLKKELENLNLDSKTELKVFGFVENMQEFIQASDVVLGKPGASQTFEVLVKNKPIIYNTYLRNEYPTLEFVRKNKFGWYTPKINQFLGLMKEMDKDLSMLNQASKNISKYKFKSCSDEIARFLVSRIK